MSHRVDSNVAHRLLPKVDLAVMDRRTSLRATKFDVDAYVPKVKVAWHCNLLNPNLAATAEVVS